MIVINLQDKKEYNISVSRDGENAMPCPVCSHDRKKKNDKCFSFNYSKKVGRCNHCDVVLVEKRDYTNEKKYTRPELTKQKSTLSPKVVAWFAERCISIGTLNHFGIGEGETFMPKSGTNLNTIQFNYYRNGELINIKYRDGNKDFKMESGAELIFYNIDAVLGSNKVLIVEGEPDCLACHEAGIRYVISVPNGANLNKNNLTYLDNCIDLFDEETEFIIGVDNDDAGNNLANELVRRLGAENCSRVNWRDCKDANEVLVKHGPLAVREAVETATQFPISGIFTASDLSKEIDEYRRNGLPPGCGIDVPEHDELIKFHEGYVTVVTGIPSHGKSEYLDDLMVRLNLKHGWPFGIYSPENDPLQLHFAKISEKLIGKGFDYMNESEINLAKAHFDDNFYFIKPEENSRLDSIFEKAAYLVRKKGIRGLIIDPWNKIEDVEDDTNLIGKTLDRIIMFASKKGIHIFLVAHPTKIQKKKGSVLYEVPNLYNISGSSNFFNKPANGVTVYRNYETGRTEVYWQKVKFKHAGKPGMVEFQWDWRSGRYYRHTPDNRNWLTKTSTQVTIDMDAQIEGKKEFIPTGDTEIPF